MPASLQAQAGSGSRPFHVGNCAGMARFCDVAVLVLEEKPVPDRAISHTKWTCPEGAKGT